MPRTEDKLKRFQDEVKELEAIRSQNKWALFCDGEVVSGHDDGSEAQKALAAHVDANPKTHCRIYRRTSFGWILIG